MFWGAFCNNGEQNVGETLYISIFGVLCAFRINVLFNTCSGMPFAATGTERGRRRYTYRCLAFCVSFALMCCLLHFLGCLLQPREQNVGGNAMHFDVWHSVCLFTLLCCLLHVQGCLLQQREQKVGGNATHFDVWDFCVPFALMCCL